MNKVFKLERCGFCGQYSNDPRLFSKEEQENPVMVDCGCSNFEYNPTPRELFEAGIISKSEYENL